MTDQPQSKARTAALQIERVAIRRGDRLILQGLDLTLDPGAVLILAGPNGAGKTSLLRALAGLLPCAEGRVRHGALDLAQDREAYAAQLHYLGHRDAVKLALTPRENLRFWISLLGAGWSDGATALAAFGLSALADVPAALLSAGQKRRAALARLAAIPRPLWLLDEPATALDSDGRGRLDAAIARHRAAGGIVVLASHGESVPPGARVLELRAGGPGALR